MSKNNAAQEVADAARHTYRTIRTLRKTMPTRTAVDRATLANAIALVEAAWWDTVTPLFAEAKHQHWAAYEADMARARTERPATFRSPGDTP